MDLERYTVLWKQDSIAQQTLATQQATVDQLKATVQADQAQIDTAKVQLDYTTIRAPISGRTGVRLVDPGNIVRATDNTGIVGINQIDPIAVLFTLPEDRFQDINRAIRDHGRSALEVQAFAREDNTLLGSGKLMLVNNQIDTATGTVQLKAQFPECRAQAVARPVRERPSGAGHAQPRGHGAGIGRAARAQRPLRLCRQAGRHRRGASDTRRR